jgi:ATP-dependent Clp protease ATP-binding subunit ClpC
MGIFNFMKQGKSSSDQTAQPQNQVVTTQSDVKVEKKTEMYNGVGPAPGGAITTDGIIPPKSQPIDSQVPVQPNQTGNQSTANATNNQTTGTDNKPTSQPEPDKASSGQKPGLDIMTRLTQRSNRVLSNAATKAAAQKSQFVDSEHVLLGLLTDQEISTLLSSLKIIPQEIEKQLAEAMKPGNSTTPPQISPRVKKILEDALIIARKLGYEFISPEHILHALYNEGEGLGARTLSKMGLNKDELGIKVLGKKRMAEDGEQAEEKPKALEKFATDLTQKALEGKLDPVVERSNVIERVIHILSRRAKNNPALIGEAGVGKTAIVEGLAQKIVAKEVPETLLNKRVLELDLMAMIAGAAQRGEYEKRFKAVLDELKENTGQVILFIDEVHNITAGGEGAGDAANILKPALARGEIQLIGATTTSEYRKHIEKDPALERRFQPIVVPEPTEEQAIKMMYALRDKFEAFHKVKIPNDALEASVRLSKRYVGGRFLPDKSIDLIDETSSAVRLPIISLPEEISSVETRIKSLQQEKDESVKIGNKVKANVLEKKIIDSQDELRAKQEEYQQRKAQAVGVVTVDMIKDIISRWTGIPVNKIGDTEKEKIAKLEDIMHERLIGQNSAITSVSQAIRRGRAGLKNTKRPIGSFVFLGPTGVGKTELVKTLAEVLFGTEDSMIRFDMTEYMEKHEVAKLLGAPPGYVGYEEGGKLTEAVKRKPYSVVLFDEVEKAHPDIFNILLQILDDGRLTDNKGHTISFKNTVVICTSNIGSRLIQEELMKKGKDQIEEPPALSTYAVSPRGREILTIGNLLFIKDTQSQNWQEKLVKDYFAGQQVTEVNAEGKENKVIIDSFSLNSHTISPQGSEYISVGENIYIRTATTAKEWKKQKLLEYFANHTVINALPDTPEDMLPTVQLSTHAFTPQEEEIITYKNRLWKRKTNTTDWQTMTLADYLKEEKTEGKKPLPTANWDIHLFNSKGEEVIIVGEKLYRKTKMGWVVEELVNYFGNNFPLEEKINQVKEITETADEQKFAKLKKVVMVELLKFMRPELVNRFDEVIVFEPLKYWHMLLIVKLQIKSLEKLLEEQSLGLEITEFAQKEIARLGFDPVYGARPLRRAIQQYVENPISEIIIANKAKEGDVIVVDFDGVKLTFTISEAKLNNLQGKGVTKRLSCTSCGNTFETEVLPQKSTAICNKCGKEIKGVNNSLEEKDKQTKENIAVENDPNYNQQSNHKTEPTTPTLAAL